MKSFNFILPTFLIWFIGMGEMKLMIVALLVITWGTASSAQSSEAVQETICKCFSQFNIKNPAYNVTIASINMCFFGSSFKSDKFCKGKAICWVSKINIELFYQFQQFLEILVS